MKKTFDVKRLTTLALLTTIALTIFVVESAIPTLVPQGRQYHLYIV